MTAYGTGRPVDDKTDIAAGISQRSVLLASAGAGALAPTVEATSFVRGAHMSWMPPRIAAWSRPHRRTIVERRTSCSPPASHRAG